MKVKWVSFAILAASLVVTFILVQAIPSELAPLDDRSLLRYSVTGSEGASYEFMTKYMDKVSNFVQDSIPEMNVNLEIISPGSGGGGSANSGFGRVGLVPPDQRTRTQQQIADYLSKKLSRYPDARALVIQEQTISGGGSGSKTSLPVQFVIQNQDFEKIRKVLPAFFAEVSKARFSRERM